ncbi:MAG: DUF499 domain-containing protein [Candidatus Sumerlaeota bacterium]|nr:DUF499 domain-containing protein [Candidatus Sumerlaeota bacterium]
MSRTAWKPWHKVVDLRDDVRTSELSLAMFAADLDAVMMGTARKVYQDPAEFFALTVPTHNLRELAKDVALRLAGKSDRAVRQLELTYGGGKTHALITMYHLAKNPAALPDVPAVQEFIEHIGMRTLPQARVVVLSFDKLDVEKGKEVAAPDGKKRWLRNPWSVLAYQIAGAEGIEMLHADGKDEERDSAPAENLLIPLLAMPQKDGLATLILIDEVLMYAREKVGFDPAWRCKLLNFFQYLTQAVLKADRCAIVASLLATDPRKSDLLGKELTQELYGIFRREREEGVQPVLKEDVAEVLRRRFFTQESIMDREKFRQHVIAALKGIGALDDQTKKDGRIAEERYLKSFPFHPDLTEVLYSKWTNLEGFQRTRGVLRTFAIALRGAEKWDDCPLVSANVFLAEPKAEGISEAARELTTIAETEEYEGKRQSWTGILEGELAKAREIQSQSGGIGFREIEQAVFATFLHSQPSGQKALTRELMVLLGSTRSDKIDLEKSLKQWAEKSWFLDDEAAQDMDSAQALPKSWRLGSKPNLKQMHSDALLRIGAEVVDSRLITEIEKQKNLTAGASAAGAKVHLLPDKPRDIEDDGEFHFAVLGPKAVSESGKPSSEAKRFIDETTGADRPRVNRNAIVLAAPSREGLDFARARIKDHLAWLEVQAQLKDKSLDPIRDATLCGHIDGSRKKIPEAIQQAYCIVVTVAITNDVQAFKVQPGDAPLFHVIKADKKSRIQETAVDAGALLPGVGPYDLWREDESERFVKDLVGAFAQLPKMPKMLNRKAILDTLIAGCREGKFVLQARRSDRSKVTFWFREPDEAYQKDPSLEVVLSGKAELAELSSALIAPQALPGFWSKPEMTLGELVQYFRGGHVVQVKREGYEESFDVPKAQRKLVEAAVSEAVKQGKLWLLSGTASILSEEIPAGLLADDAILQAPPQPITYQEVLPENLPGAWIDGAATAQTIALNISKKACLNLPWLTIRNAIEGAILSRAVELSPDSLPFPCDYTASSGVRLRIPAVKPYAPPGIITPPPPPPPVKGVIAAQAELRPNEIQDLAEQIGEITKAAAGTEMRFVVRIEFGGDVLPPAEVVEKINEILKDVSGELRLR